MLQIGCVYVSTMCSLSLVIFQTKMQDFKYLSNHLNSVQVFSINSNEKSYTENVYRCHCIQSRHVMCHTKSARIITYTKRRTWTQSSAYSYGLGFKKSGVWIWRVFRWFWPYFYSFLFFYNRNALISKRVCYLHWWFYTWACQRIYTANYKPIAKLL